VLEIDGGKVRLGFEADAAVPVHRFEVWEQIYAGPCARGPSRGPPPNGS
jgi:sRNA-binding carbon storage regulator CsrA